MSEQQFLKELWSAVGPWLPLIIIGVVLWLFSRS